MGATTENGVHYQRVVFCDIDNLSFNTTGKLINGGYIEETEMNTTELSAGSVRQLEDDVQAQATLTEDEAGSYTDITWDELQQFKEDLGQDVYDALLQEEIDLVMLVRE